MNHEMKIKKYKEHLKVILKFLMNLRNEYVHLLISPVIEFIEKIDI